MFSTGLADTDCGLERSDAIGGLYGRGLSKQWIDCRRSYSDHWSVVLNCADPLCVPCVERLTSELTGHVNQHTQCNEMFAEYIERFIDEFERICSAINDT